MIALTTRPDPPCSARPAGGKFRRTPVVAFLGFSALSLLPVPASRSRCFISVLLDAQPRFRDSEMVIWFNSGLSLAAWMRPVLIFAAPLVLVIALLSLVVSPMAAEMSEQYRSRIDARDELSRVEPGVFGESRDKERVFFRRIDRRATGPRCRTCSSIRSSTGAAA
jgi:lipopolysaccharide export system permease protein